MEDAGLVGRAWRLFTATRASGVALIAVLLLGWEASVRWGLAVSDNWPPFSDVIKSLALGVASGELPAVMTSTLWCMARGYVIGVALALFVGSLMATMRSVRATLEPAVELLRPVPVTAVIPPLIFILGVDDALKVFMVAFTSFFPVLLNTMAGILSVDGVHRNVARTFGTSPWREFRRVVVPSSLPYVLAGMRTSLALALIVTIVAEMIAGSSGIGHHLVMMQFALRPADMYAGIILLAAVGYALNYGFVRWEGSVIHWSRSREDQAASA